MEESDEWAIYKRKKSRGSLAVAFIIGATSILVQHPLDKAGVPFTWVLSIGGCVMAVALFAFRRAYKLRCPSCNHILNPMTDDLACVACGIALREGKNDRERSALAMKARLANTSITESSAHPSKSLDPQHNDGALPQELAHEGRTAT